jgi:uncharacterized protein
MKRFVFVVAISVAFAGTSYAADSGKIERMITVQGKGKVTAIPDVARLRIEVVHEGPKIDSINQEVRQSMEKILRALSHQGVADKDVQTQSYQVTPKIEWRNGRSLRNGYIISNQVMATVRDMKKVGAVLTAVLDAGANNVQGPDFTIDDPSELERRALSLALQDARAKAALLAKAAETTLGDVLTVQENGVMMPPPRLMRMKTMAMEARAEAAAEPVAPGEETVEATVTASFALK